MISFKNAVRNTTAAAFAALAAVVFTGCSDQAGSDQLSVEQPGASSETIEAGENTVTYDEAVSVVESDPAETTASSENEPESNPMPESKPVETKPEDNKEDEKPVNPAGTKSSDGKYTLTETDIENPDGTYSETLTNDTVDPVTGEIVTAEEIKTWGLDDYKSNPSQIPYSQITVDNAAEAFPYLGWCGYTPDYIEVEPDMTDEEILKVIAANLYCSTPGYGNALTPQNYPRFFFKSEAEYNAFLADEAAKAAAIDERSQRAKEGAEAVIRGEETIGGNGSEDFYNNLLNSR